MHHPILIYICIFISLGHCVHGGEVRYVHPACIYARERQVESLHGLHAHREISIYIRSAWHVAHCLYVGILAPCGQFLVSAALQGQSCLYIEVGAVCRLGVEVHSLHVGAASVASLLNTVVLGVITDVLQIEDVGERGVERLGKEVYLEMSRLD